MKGHCSFGSELRLWLTDGVGLLSSYVFLFRPPLCSSAPGSIGIVTEDEPSFPACVRVLIVFNLLVNLIVFTFTIRGEKPYLMWDTGDLSPSLEMCFLRL